MTQQQEFRILQSFRDFQLREYQPCVLAEVKVKAQFDSATSIAFNSLFQYISTGNRTGSKIAMTAPVIAAQLTPGKSHEWFVSFVMPPGSTFGQLPDPNDPQIKLRELDTEICIAMSFKGKATAKLSDKKIQELRAAAAKEKIALSHETRICRFDPPYKPGFLQYNEVVIPLKG